MRLGGYQCDLVKSSLIYNLFKDSGFILEGSENTIIERHRHRLEVQSEYVPKLEENGLKVVGKHWYDSKNSGQKEFLVELIELDKNIHPYFVATQSHPEFLGRPDKAHPLFEGLIRAGVERG